MGRDKLADYGRLIPRVVRLIVDGTIAVSGTPSRSVALHQIRGYGIGPQRPARSRPPAAPSPDLNGDAARVARSRVVIVAAQHDDYIRSLRRLIHHPELSASRSSGTRARYSAAQTAKMKMKNINRKKIPPRCLNSRTLIRPTNCSDSPARKSPRQLLTNSDPSPQLRGGVFREASR